MRIYFGDVFPVRMVTIIIEYENSDDKLNETSSISLINSDYTETHDFSLSSPNSVKTLTSQIKRYKIYCEDKEGIGIKFWKVENRGLWCLSEVAAKVKAADPHLAQPGKQV